MTLNAISEIYSKLLLNKINLTILSATQKQLNKLNSQLVTLLHFDLGNGCHITLRFTPTLPKTLTQKQTIVESRVNFASNFSSPKAILPPETLQSKCAKVKACNR